MAEAGDLRARRPRGALASSMGEEEVVGTMVSELKEALEHPWSRAAARDDLLAFTKRRYETDPMNPSALASGAATNVYKHKKKSSACTLL